MNKQETKAELRKAKERKRLLYELKRDGEYTNNTVYKNEFRAARLANMIDIITGYLYDHPQLFLKDEQDKLLYLIRYISRVMIKKSARNKHEVRSALIRYETLVESAKI